MTQKINILALHGFTGCGGDFTGFSGLLGNAEAWHCPDLPGHGSAADLDSCPESTLAWVQSTSGPSNVLLGYSMGARAALLHATRFPEKWRALILISANPGIESAAERAARREADERLAARIEQEGTQTFLDYWQETPLIQSQKRIRPDWRTKMQANRLQQSPKGLANSLRQFGQGSCPNLWPEMKNLKMPVLLISGSEDQKYSLIAERICKDLKLAGNQAVEHAIIEGASHMPHLERPALSSKEIDQFLSRQLELPRSRAVDLKK
jgi:2-succinyl-6-hydroxy-2,4-cyclohexadiene-1-carboxylate synthase